MSDGEAPLKVVIAADTAMSRDVVRFFLQSSDGIEVMAEAASAEDASWMADKYTADAVVLHAGIAFDEMHDAVRRIRDAAPEARIVVVTPEGAGVPLPADSRGADSYLEEGVGLAELSFVLRSLCRSPDIAIDVAPTFPRHPSSPLIVVPEPAPEPELVLAGAPARAGRLRTGGTPSASPSAEPPAAVMDAPRRGLIPLFAAASAFVLVVALSLYRTHVEDVLTPAAASSPGGLDAGPHARTLIRASRDDLHALADSLDGRRLTNAPALARKLIDQRSQAIAAGADVSQLDEAIATTLKPIIAASPSSVAVAVLTVLAPVMPWANADLDHLLIEATPGQTPAPVPTTDGPTADQGSGPVSGEPVDTPSQRGAGTSDDAAGGLGGGGEGGAAGGGAPDAGNGGGHTGDAGNGNPGGSGGGGGHGGGGGSGGHGGGGGDHGGGGEHGGGDGGGGSGDGDDSEDGDGDQAGGDDHDGDGDQSGQDGGDHSVGDGENDHGGDDQGDQGDGSAGAPGGDDGCDHPGNGGGHGYGNCDGHGAGNDGRGDSEHHRSTGDEGDATLAPTVATRRLRGRA